MLDYLMLFSGSLVGLDIEKWVPTKKSLGSADIEVKTGNNLLNTIMLHSWKSELKLNGSIQTKQRSMWVSYVDDLQIEATFKAT